MEISDRIKQRMTDLDLKAVDIVTRTGLSKGTVSQWVNGHTSPRGENLQKLCAVLRCAPEWLQFGVGGGIEPTSNVAPAYFKEPRKFPVISWVQAGEWSEAIDMFHPGDADQWESSDCNVGENAFWLRVVGDSMTAPSGLSIPEGHMILVDPASPADNGSLVIAKLTDSDEVTFKKLVIDAGQKYLKPLNPNYRTIEINGNCRIVGVVKEAKIKL
ncbi:LexA family transcriptional regulator [Marinobacterium sp. MBR-109]|jgi:SOS-response transcriptional repressor LexA|uniref:LexA family protein n=1 Tax=Marinobacterium sp. MBR-109 TaxID=3156462 RepID=UPI003390C586